MSVALYLIAGAGNLIWFCYPDRLSDFTQVVIPVITVLLVLAGALIRLRELSGQERGAYFRRVLMGLLCYYCFILCALLFFGGPFGMERSWGGAVNLQPMYSVRRYLIHYRRTGSLVSLFNLVGNVMLLVPLGVMLPILFRSLRRFWIAIPVLALLGVGIEALQWWFGVGVADVDDAILNGLGAVSGFLLARLCQLIYFTFTKRGRV